MFNLIVSFNSTAWETDQLMRMDADRFQEYSGSEAASVSWKKPITLLALEGIPTLLMYERGSKGPNTETARYGKLSDIRVSGAELVFMFREEGRFPMAIVREYAERLSVGQWEQNRTHWAIKDKGIPKAMLAKMQRSYDVVFSFAGEDRKYVERVAKYLRSQEVTVFYDGFEEAALWGKDLAEHFDSVYRQSGQYCVIFISKFYADKMWTTHERRSALARALSERREYILPARFDKTELPGILPTVAHISASDKTPIALGKLILKKLDRQPVKSTRKKKGAS
jgi:hypothetical protein